MKRILLATVAVAAFAAQALASDLPSTKEAPAFVPPPIFTWTGVYTGEHVGAMWANAEFSSPGLPSVSVDPVMGFFGGHYGYQYLYGQWVLGVQGEYDVINENSSSNPNFRLHERWLASVDGKVGYAMDRWLPYVIGGVAFSEMNHYVGGVHFNKDVTGFDVGAGLEYGISENWSAFAEYRYYDFGTANWAATGGACIAAPCGIPAHGVSKS